MFPPACVLRSLTAQAPVEMQQELMSDQLILVQSCHRSFCCSACHNLSCLLRPHHPSPLPNEPNSWVPNEHPHGETLWMQISSGPIRSPR